MVLLYWSVIGLVAGLVAHAFLRARGDQGYNVFGEVMLGSLGSLSLAMSIGVLAGWGQMFTRSGTMFDIIASGLTAAFGAAAVLVLVCYLTLKGAPVRDQDRIRS